MSTTRRIAGAAVTAAAAGLAAAALAAPGDLALVSLTDAGAQGDRDVTAAATSADGRHVAVVTAARLTAADTGGVAQLYVRDRVTGRTVLASAGVGGQPADQAVDDQDSDNVFVSLSGDGRYAVFASGATNLVPGDGNGGMDVFRKDLVTGEVVLVSVNGQGQQANAGVLGDTDTSYDGSRVVFRTGSATNLFGADANGAVSDLVVRDVAAGTTTLVSQTSGGVQAQGTTERPAISADGRVVVFEAVQDDHELVPGDVNMANDILVRDLEAGTTTAATRLQAGAQGGGFPDVSGDGRYVVFESGDRLDPAGDANMQNDAYRFDRVTGQYALASAGDGTGTASAQGGRRATVSADGTRVAFQTTGGDLIGAGLDANNVDDVYVRTLPTARTSRVSGRPDGTGSPNASTVPQLAQSGGLATFVHLEAAAGKLVAGDANARADALALELVPTDTSGPSLAVAATPPETTAETARISGTVADPAGVGLVTVAGRAVRPGAGGTFAADVPLAVGPNAIEVRAVDGAGNAVGESRSLVRTVPAATPPAVPPGAPPAQPPAAPRPRGTVLGARLIAPGRVQVRVRLLTPARVRLQVLRRVARRGRVSLRPVGRPLTRALGPGVRVLVVRVPALAPGRYTVRATLARAGRALVIPRALVVPRRA